MDCWYFAYGSNLLHEQIVARTTLLEKDSEPHRIARLPCRDVTFNVLGDDGKYYANATEPGDGVLGILYHVDSASLDILDGHEHLYTRQAVEVIDQHDIHVLAATYIGRPERCTTPGRPDPAYLDRIIRGARAHGLPDKYIQSIIDSANA